MSSTLLFIVTTDINVIVAESTGVAQVEDLMGSLGAEDGAVQASADEPSVVEFVAAPVSVEATTTAVTEVLALASSLKRFDQMTYIYKIVIEHERDLVK